MPNRSQRRIKHRLIPWPKHKPLPFRGIKVNINGQRVWTCSCGNGWMIMCVGDPRKAHAAHIESMLAEPVEAEV